MRLFNIPKLPIAKKASVTASVTSDVFRNQITPPRIAMPSVTSDVFRNQITPPRITMPVVKRPSIASDLLSNRVSIASDVFRLNNKGMGDFGYTPDYYAMGTMGSFDPCKCNDFMYQLKYPSDCGQVALGIKKCVKTSTTSTTAPTTSISTAPATVAPTVSQPQIITIPAPAQDNKTMMYVAIGGAALVGVVVLMMAMRR